jgi:hypothetical protein
MAALALAAAAAPACTRAAPAERAPEARPLPTGRASASAPVPTAATPTASASAPPVSSAREPQLGPADAVVEERSAKWRARIFSRAFDPKRLKELSIEVTQDNIRLKTERKGAFAIVVASFPVDPADGTLGETEESLAVTKEGAVELKGAARVEGLADLDGDGRLDLVLGGVTVIADRPTGPLELAVGDKGGAFGWSDVRIAAHEGKPALVATTRTDSSECIECARGGFGYSRTRIRGAVEEVTLAWNGKILAAVARKPMETQAELAARTKAAEAENKRQAARWEQEKREMAARHKEWAAQAAAEAAKELAECKKACAARCSGSDAGAGCLATCQSRCGK